MRAYIDQRGLTVYFAAFQGGSAGGQFVLPASAAVGHDQTAPVAVGVRRLVVWWG